MDLISLGAKGVQIFPDAFFVTDMMKTVLTSRPWQFSRNMTVVRDGDSLSLINSVRLDDDGSADLDALGRVTNVIKIGTLHGRDDAFYRHGATLWAVPGTVLEHELIADRILSPGGEMPFAACNVFVFKTTKLPE